MLQFHLGIPRVFLNNSSGIRTLPIGLIHFAGEYIKNFPEEWAVPYGMGIRIKLTGLPGCPYPSALPFTHNSLVFHEQLIKQLIKY